MNVTVTRIDWLNEQDDHKLQDMIDHAKRQTATPASKWEQEIELLQGILADRNNNSTTGGLADIEAAGLPTHAHQLAYHHSIGGGTDHNDALIWARTHPMPLQAENDTVWTDSDIIGILQDCAQIDQVTDRPLGIWECTRLTQRDMIRKGIRS